MNFEFVSPSLISSLFFYRYVLLYLGAIFEGPGASLASGFMYSVGIVNPILALIFVVLGDMTSDLFFYYLGRFGGMWRPTKWFIKRFNLESKKNKIIDKKQFFRYDEGRSLQHVIHLKKFSPKRR